MAEGVFKRLRGDGAGGGSGGIFGIGVAADRGVSCARAGSEGASEGGDDLSGAARRAGRRRGDIFADVFYSAVQGNFCGRGRLAAVDYTDRGGDEPGDIALW